MTDAIPTREAERFTEVFAAFQTRIHAYIHHRIGGRDWHLAEDLTSEVFLKLFCSHTVKGRRIDGRVFGLLTRIAQCVIADHFRLARNARESAVDFTDPVEARHLSLADSAEDWAVANLTRDAMLADSPAALLPVTPSAEDQALTDNIALAMLTAPIGLGVAA
jgi:DNA-directed RNA polymerase specialized sigma24 family protein